MIIGKQKQQILSLIESILFGFLCSCTTWIVLFALFKLAEFFTPKSDVIQVDWLGFNLTFLNYLLPIFLISTTVILLKIYQGVLFRQKFDWLKLAGFIFGGFYLFSLGQGLYFEFFTSKDDPNLIFIFYHNPYDFGFWILILITVILFTLCYSFIRNHKLGEFTTDVSLKR